MSDKKTVTFLLCFLLLFLHFFTCQYFLSVDITAKTLLFISCLFVLIVCVSKFDKVDVSFFHIILFVFAISLLVVSLFSFNKVWSVVTSLVFLAYSVFLLCSSQVLKFPIFRNYCLSTIVLTGVISSVLGLYEYVCFVTFGPTKGMLISYLLPVNVSNRIGGVFGQPNIMSIFLLVVLLAMVKLYLYTDLRPFRFPSLRFASFLPFFLVAFVFFKTGSRSGLLSFFLVTFVLIVLVYKFKDLIPDKRKLGVICLVIVGAYLFGDVLDFSGFGERIFKTQGLSIDARFVFWASAFLIFIDNPVFGSGLNTFQFLQNSYSPKAHELLGFVSYEAMGNTNWAHNEFLQLLAEGGSLSLLFLVVSACLFVKSMIKSLKDRDSEKGFFIYYLIVFSIIIHSCFSWPLRHPYILCIFILFCSIISTGHLSYEVFISPSLRKKIALTLIALFIVFSLAIYYEVKLFSFDRSFGNNSDISSTIDDLKHLTLQDYTGYRALNIAVPRYVNYVLEYKDINFAHKVLPFALRLTSMEGTPYQWLALAHLYLRMDLLSESEVAIKRAIDLRPSDDSLWSFLHYINMIKASRATGKPIEFFYPLGQEVDISNLELFDERN